MTHGELFRLYSYLAESEMEEMEQPKDPPLQSNPPLQKRHPARSHPFSLHSHRRDVDRGFLMLHIVLRIMPSMPNRKREESLRIPRNERERKGLHPVGEGCIRSRRATLDQVGLHPLRFFNPIIFHRFKTFI